MKTALLDNKLKLDESASKDSKYVKGKTLIYNYDLMLFIFLYTFILLPQYFGVALAGFDITASRFFLMLFLVLIISNSKYSKGFFTSARTIPILGPVLVFEFVVIYTGLIRTDLNTLMNATLEFLFIFLFYYLLTLKDNYRNVFRIVVICSYILCIHGIFEYVTKINLFHKLQTISGNFSVYTRSGSIRIMGPCGHALAYGLLLILLFGFICIDYDKRRINLLQHKILFLLFAGNVLFTGSRSTLLMFGLEVVLLFLLSKHEEKKQTLLFFFVLVTVMFVLVTVFSNLGISRYIMLQLTSVFDTIFGTSISLNYGAELSRLENSTSYRKLLIKIFQIDYLNPFIGRGISRSNGFIIDGAAVVSIDNFYISTYIKYAYPGLVAYVIFLLKMIIDFTRDIIKRRDGVYIALFISLICYFVNLWWLDSLQTLRYAYLVIAILYALMKTDSTKEILVGDEKRSKYII